MFIRIQSSTKQSEVRNIEWGDRQITFFFSDFFYLDFENDEEKEKFLSEFREKLKENYPNGQSYIELDDSLIGEQHSWNGFVVQDTTKLNVNSYRFTYHNDHLEISFSSGKEDIKFVLYKQILDKIKDNLK
jgi:hypothetical protein